MRITHHAQLQSTLLTSDPPQREGRPPHRTQPPTPSPEPQSQTRVQGEQSHDIGRPRPDEPHRGARPRSPTATAGQAEQRSPRARSRPHDYRISRSPTPRRAILPHTAHPEGRGTAEAYLLGGGTAHSGREDNQRGEAGQRNERTGPGATPLHNTGHDLVGTG